MVCQILPIRIREDTAMPTEISRHVRRRDLSAFSGVKAFLK